jgi:hypothetical protein
MRIFDGCTNDLGEPTEEVGERGRKLVTANESTIVAKALFDAVVMEDC